MASFKEPEGKVQTTEAPLQQASAGMEATDLARQRTMPRRENAAESEMEKGLIAERKGRLSEAIGHFLALARKRPGSAAVHTALGRLYSKRGNYILAINEFRLAAEYAPGDSEPLYALSVLYARLGSGSSALQYLKKVIEKDARVRERAFHEPAFSAFRRDPGFQMLFSSFTEKSKP
jgi:tetratricopeptide (TPR) repeat protein